MPDDQVTKQDLRAALSESEARLTRNLTASLKESLTEVMRDMQTEILRGFEAHSTAVTIRLRKLEADHSNLDAAASGRIEVLERRLFEIEKRLGLAS